MRQLGKDAIFIREYINIINCSKELIFKHVNNYDSYLEKSRMLNGTIKHLSNHKRLSAVYFEDKIYVVSDRNIVLLNDTHKPLFSLTYFTKIDISECKLYNGGSVERMFMNCKAKEIELMTVDKTQLKSTAQMFYKCCELEKLDLKTIDTSNVTDMTSMFEACMSLKELDISKLNTDKVTRMKQMFKGCMSLNRIDLSSFNTNNVETMEEMFCLAAVKEPLDLSNFQTTKLKNIKCMFIYFITPELNIASFKEIVTTNKQNVDVTDMLMEHKCGKIVY